MQARTCVRAEKRGRRGMVAAQVAISLTTLVGFMALAVDVGAMYNTKAELQRTADAAAMAAANEIGKPGDSPLVRARAAASDFAASNPVLNEPVGLAGSDVIFGIASRNPDGKYSFTETEVNPNAVRVRVRRTEGSPSGPMGLYFARIFGINTANISAEATALLIPRDICFVLDLSLSHSFDSQLMHYRLTDVGGPMKDVWQHLWDTAHGEPPEGSGPTFGNMNDFGSDSLASQTFYTSDTGLTQLKRGTAWNLGSDWTSQSLAAWRATQSAEVQAQHPAAYTAAEMAVINSCTGAGTETSTTNSTQKANYRRRVLVALGIYRWKSGLPGGQPGGDGDNIIDAGEVVQVVPYPSCSSNPWTKSKQIGGSWDGLVNYVSDISKADNITSDTGLSYRFLKYDPDNTCYGSPQLRWRFGIKTMLDYVQQQEYTHADSPGLAGAPQQPMKAVVEGVKTAIDYIESLNGDDRIGMVAYGQVGYGPSDYPNNLSWLTTDFNAVRAKVDLLQAAMWTGNTCISQGIDKAAGTGAVTTGVLNGPNSRTAAKKIIFLLTDGNANVRRNGVSDSSPYTNAINDMLAAATDAAAPTDTRAGCLIYTVCVGADADTAGMEQVAAIGNAAPFVAAGDIVAYQQQLQNIFLDLGAKRPITLIQ